MSGKVIFSKGCKAFTHYIKDEEVEEMKLKYNTSKFIVLVDYDLDSIETKKERARSMIDSGITPFDLAPDMRLVQARHFGHIRKAPTAAQSSCLWFRCAK